MFAFLDELHTIARHDRAAAIIDHVAKCIKEGAGVKPKLQVLQVLGELCAMCVPLDRGACDVDGATIKRISIQQKRHGIF